MALLSRPGDHRGPTGRDPVIAEDKVAEIRERTDLVALVREYIALKRSGTSFKGLCPFHGEKTPSFYVHPDRGFFHCFGCQMSGDAISFLMRIEGHSFPDAARVLAERSGIEITALDSEEEQAHRQARARRERLLAIVESAAGFYVKMLSEHSLGAMGRAELSSRGIDDATAKTFRLGYAPHGWDELATFLASRGHSPNDCEQVGLVVPRRQGSGYYDRFRHRLMFPVADSHGNIVAFSGRALAPPPGDDRAQDEPPAKYVNSPETALYKKGDILFGLHEARVSLRRSEIALVCEGNFDVLSLAQHGFDNVVAPLGTAFTPQQAKLLRRYASTAVLIFDADAAGRKAVRAAQPLLAQAGVAGKVVTLPPKSDPDSFLREKGQEAMARLVASAPSIVEWLIETGSAEAGADPHAKAEAIEALGPVLASLDNPVEARLYIERVAAVFEVRDVGAVREQLRRGVRASRGQAPRGQAQGQGPQGAQGHTPRGQTPQGADARPAGSRGARPYDGRPGAAGGARLPAHEARIVGAFLDHPSLHESGYGEKVHRLLTSDELRAIFSLTTRWVGSRGVDASGLLEEIDDDSPAREWLERRLAIQEFEEVGNARRFVELAIADLARRHLALENKRLSREILAARRAGDDDLADTLTRRTVELYQSAPRRGASLPSPHEGQSDVDGGTNQGAAEEELGPKG